MVKSDDLSSSILFNSLLKGYEIRFSDMIQYLIKKYNYVPFGNGDVANIEVSREKNKTDIWIDRILEENGNERPFFILEIKLNSLASEEQLIKYSERFLFEVYESIKEPKKNYKMFEKRNESFKNAIKSSSFFILSPVEEDQFTIQMDHPLYKMLKNDISKEEQKQRGGNKKSNKKEYLDTNGSYLKKKIEVKWVPKTYTKLGDDIKQKILAGLNPSEKMNKKCGNCGVCENCKNCYERFIIQDFVFVLEGFKSIFDELGFNESEKIKQIFKEPEIFDTLDLKPLFQKFRASQCARELEKKFNESFQENDNKRENLLAGEWNVKGLKIGDCVIKHTYSDLGKSGLFEIIKKIDENNAIIVQCEKNILKLGLVFQNSENGSPDWPDDYLEKFSNNWFDLKIKRKGFEKMKKKNEDTNSFYNTYKIKEPFKFFYKKCDISNLQFSAVLDFMVSAIKNFELVE